MKILEIYIDGASKGNPGLAGIGVVICKNGEVIGNVSKFIGETTNNVAEYKALVFALQEALIEGADKVRVFSDSQLLVNQINGEYKIKSEHLKLLYEQAAHLKKGFQFFEISHIARTQNRGADKLANLAIQDRKRH